MKGRPLSCPNCRKNDWDVLRAADTGDMALTCNSCRLCIALPAPRDVPTLDGQTARA